MPRHLIHVLLAAAFVALAASVQSASEKTPPVDLATLLATAEGGDAQAQCELGLYHSEGQEDARDLAKARFWFQKAAEQGHAEGQRRVGRLYDFVDSSIHDPRQAARWYTLAAEQGDAVALNNLANLLFAGDGVPRDEERGFSLLRQAAEQGYALARRNLGARYNDLGLAYRDGKGVGKDCARAAELYELGAAQGDLSAMNNRGLLATDGCLPVDWELAAKWFQKAAEQGHGWARYNLAIQYERGQGVPLDKKEAFRLYLKAAQQGLPASQGAVGQCYYRGMGVEPNNREALKWLRLAIEAGDDASICNLGFMYERGLGVDKDDSEALRLFLQCANRGMGQCQFNLGVLYRDGHGTPTDTAASYFWFSLADRAEVLHAGTRAKDVRRLLSPVQVAETDGRLAAWSIAPVK